MANFELEAKFWLPDLVPLQRQAVSLGASLISARQLEYNLRFDTRQHALSKRGEVLRLRRAGAITLTYKQPGNRPEVRQELEIEVDQFEVARRLLESLGYVVIHRYEKYREVLKIDHCLVMLDEVPYGSFAEVEGPDLSQIQSTCTRLQLDWDARIQRTYMDLFEALRETIEPKPSDATFENFKQFPHIDASWLHLPSGYLPSSNKSLST
jgi:adenylate cyclase class 2